MDEIQSNASKTPPTTTSATPTEACSSTPATCDIPVMPPPSSSQVPPSSTLSKRKPVRTSEIWAHFSKIEGSDRCKCNYCNRDYACNTRKCGTTTLWNHLSQCKRNPHRKEDMSQKTLTFRSKKEGECGSNLIAMGFSKEACRAACARMIIKDELPFTFVEGEGFRDFCSVACPKFDPPSRVTIARDVYQLYLEEKKKLRNLFMNNSPMVSLTTDTWTSIQNINYMVVTAHFIDSEWKLQKRILNFCQIANHKGETIGKLIESCLIEWRIEKVFTITMDNASSNDVAITYIRRRIKNWNGLVLDGQFLHMRCCAHITNLIVSDGLKDHITSIDLIRRAVRYVRSSPSRLATFKACVEKEKIESKKLLSLDVPTRWNSTYLMLESAIKLQKAFERMEEEDGYYLTYFDNGPPVEQDWNDANLFLKFLRSFYDITLKFSGSLHVTSHLFVIEFCKIQQQLSRCILEKNGPLSTMAENMKLKCDKYWGSIDKINNLLFVAAVLDPRYKLDYMIFSFGKLYSSDVCETMIKRVKETLGQLFDFYAASDTSTIDIQSSKNVKETNFEVYERDNDDEDDLLWEYKKRRVDNTSKIKNEVDRYLMEPTEDCNNQLFDLLDWWKLNSTKFKVLSSMARDVFAVPLSTVASESAFSTGGRILDPFRSSLTPKMVEALICSQNWLSAIPLPLDIRDRAYDECFTVCQHFELDTEYAAGTSN